MLYGQHRPISSAGEASLRWPPTDGDMTRLWGPCPLHVAAGLGDISTMLAMLSQRADVASRLARQSQPFRLRSDPAHTGIQICLSPYTCVGG